MSTCPPVQSQPAAVREDVLAGLRAILQVTRPGADVDLIRRSYDVAAFWHQGQRRKSGDPYITHPLAVATILAGTGADDEMLAAALLHDTISGDIYQAIVRHGYEGIDPHAFQPLVRVHVADHRYRGWIHVPGQPAQQQVTEMASYRKPALPAPGTAPRPPAQRARIRAGSPLPAEYLPARQERRRHRATRRSNNYGCRGHACLEVNRWPREYWGGREP